MYETRILSSENKIDLEYTAKLLLQDEVVGIPTETVYGLAANALSTKAVAKIFAAKGRPADNPLIVHLSDFSDAEKYVNDIPDLAYDIAEKFCPGPLTIVLPKKEIIPSITSGGLSTVGLRVPLHKTAREIISLCGVPLAAPSANLSGSPSPTSATHVFNDMTEKIPAIIDGGKCSIGLESTVIMFENGGIRLLRPGYVTLENLQQFGVPVFLDKGITAEISSGQSAPSPGMKYKHYSPKANVTVVAGDLEKFTNYVKQNDGEGVYSLIFDEDKNAFPLKCLTYGNSSEKQAEELFSILREIDEMGITQLYVRSPSKDGVGLAVYNRLLRSAGFEVIEI